MSMVDSGATIWHYLASFALYTLLAVGVIYAAYFVIRRNPALGNLAGLQFPKSSAQSQQGLRVESILPLEARKNLYVVRSGQERFLIATSLEGTQLLSRLVDADEAEQPEGQLTAEQPSVEPGTAADPRQRFVESLRWVFGNRFKMIPDALASQPLNREV
jgi:flagellar biogenesis protein FliO